MACFGGCCAGKVARRGLLLVNFLNFIFGDGDDPHAMLCRSSPARARVQHDTNACPLIIMAGSPLPLSDHRLAWLLFAKLQISG